MPGDVSAPRLRPAAPAVAGSPAPRRRARISRCPCRYSRHAHGMRPCNSALKRGRAWKGTDGNRWCSAWKFMFQASSRQGQRHTGAAGVLQRVGDLGAADMLGHPDPAHHRLRQQQRQQPVGQGRRPPGQHRGQHRGVQQPAPGPPRPPCPARQRGRNRELLGVQPAERCAARCRSSRSTSTGMRAEVPEVAARLRGIGMRSGSWPGRLVKVWWWWCS
jgi:hypothetical protein